MARYFDTTNPRKNRKITHFEKEIYIEIAGKKQDIRKMIHKAAEDTGIYEQIEKYGLNPETPITIEETVMDFTQIAGNLRDAIEQGMIAKQMFKNLPLDVRKEFNHDEELFMKEGTKWMLQQFEKIQKQQQQQQQTEEKGE